MRKLLIVAPVCLLILVAVAWAMFGQDESASESLSQENQGASKAPRPITEPWRAYSIVEGKVEHASAFPSPAQSDYASCLYAIEFKVQAILNGHLVPGRITVLLPAFKDYKLTGLHGLKTNDLVRIELTPFDQTPKDVQTIQQANDIDDFTLSQYYSTRIRRLKSLTHQGVAPMKVQEAYRSAFDYSINPPMTAKAARAQAQSITEKLAIIDRKLQVLDGLDVPERNQQFALAWQERQKECTPVVFEETKEIKFRAGTGRFAADRVGKGYFALATEHEFFTSRYRPLVVDRLASSMGSLRELLARHGVQLIVLFFPRMDEVAARVLVPQFAQYPSRDELLLAKALLSQSVETIVFTDLAVERATQYESMFFYPGNEHPAEGATDIATSLVADHLRRFDLRDPRVESRRFSIREIDNAYGPRYLYWPWNCPPGRTLNTPRQVPEAFYGRKPVPFPADSEVLVAGNSFIRTPGPDDSFSALLAKKISAFPSVLRIHGFGPAFNIPRKLLLEAETLLAGKKVVVLAMNRSVTELGYALDVRALDKKMRQAKSYRFTEEIALSQIEASDVFDTLDIAEHRILDPRSHTFTIFKGLRGERGHGEKVLFCRLPIPAGIDKTNPFSLRLTFCKCGNKLPDVLSNGHTQAVSLGHLRANCEQDILLEYPAHRDTIEIWVEAARCMGPILLTGIQVMQ